MQLKRFFISIVLLAGMLIPSMVLAQGIEKLPVDPAVRIGTLPNGLTYIIRKNSEPKGRANYYIAQKVGSILENDQQLGLAHFLEHMAFNGTKNFPGKNLISFLERIGCRFGADLNAYTAFDETVYTIMDAPTDMGKEVIDSCVLILHDWSSNIELDGKEIDEERGVIHEEWRSRNNAVIRTLTALLPKILPNNLYASRMPIGSMDVVLNFKHSAIRDFYHKWYRPDLQGIIIVGDIDPDYIEGKIKEYFADIPAPKNPAARTYINIENNKEPINALVTDKENTATQVKVFYKHDALPNEIKGTATQVMINYMNAVVGRIFNERCDAISQKPNAPFLGAGLSYDTYFVAKTKDALGVFASTKDGQAETSIKALARELHRVDQYGFLKSEYERAKRAVLKAYENSYNERGKRSNGSYIEEYKSYFLDGGYIPGIEMEKMLIEQIAGMVTVEQINKYVKELISSTGENLVVAVTGPEKEGIAYPKEAELAKIYLEAFKEPVEAPKEEVSNEKLIDKELKGGKIVAEKKDKKFGSTILKLQNGITVHLLPTQYKDDEIRMRGITEGGSRLYYNNDADILNSKLINKVIDLGGLGKYDQIALEKALTGYSASVGVSVGSYTTSVSGSSTIKDFEKMLQLAYLYFTDIRTDKQAYDVFKQKIIDALKMAQRDPMSSLGDSIASLTYGYDLEHRPLKIEDFDKVSYDRMLQITRERLASADGFKFFFVGNIDIEKAKPLIEKYLGSLPKGKATPKMDRTKEKMPRQGAKTLAYTTEANTPTAITLDVIHAPFKYNLRNSLISDILNGVLDQVLVASIREREGGTYSPSAYATLEEYPKSALISQVFFISDPDKAQGLNKVVFDELNILAKEGVKEAYVEKTVTNMKKVYNENLRKNGYWMNVLANYFFFDQNFHDNYMKTLEGITAKDIQAAVKTLLDSKNCLQLYLKAMPKEEKAQSVASPAKAKADDRAACKQKGCM